jgi:translation elongation factor EF-1beta
VTVALITEENLRKKISFEPIYQVALKFYETVGFGLCELKVMLIFFEKKKRLKRLQKKFKSH